MAARSCAYSCNHWRSARICGTVRGVGIVSCLLMHTGRVRVHTGRGIGRSHEARNRCTQNSVGSLLTNQSRVPTTARVPFLIPRTDLHTDSVLVSTNERLAISKLMWLFLIKYRTVQGMQQGTNLKIAPTVMPSYWRVDNVLNPRQQKCGIRFRSKIPGPQHGFVWLGDWSRI